VSVWLVSNIPSWLLLAALVLAVTLVTVVALTVVRRRFPGLQEGEHNDVAKAGFSVVGPVFGFLTGFIIVVLWGQISAADTVVRTEAASAVQMGRELDVLAKPDSDRIRQSLLDYERAAVTEWPQAAGGHTAPEAENALARLYQAYGSVQPADDRQRSALTSSLTSLKQLGTSRTERLIMARTNTGPPWTLWVVIFLISGLVLGFAVIIGEKQARTHYAMVAATGALVATILFLLTELSHPFFGEMSTTAEPLRTVIEFVER
jgi:hypothetical protein